MASILDAFKEKQTEERVYTGKKIKVGIIGFRKPYFFQSVFWQ